MQASHDFLRSSTLFGVLEAEHHALILKRSFMQRFPASTVLHDARLPATFLFCLAEGQVEQFAEAGGRRSSLGFAEPGDIWPLAAVLCDEMTLASAATTRDSRLLMIPSDIVRSLNDTVPAFARSVVAALAGQYRAVVRQLHNRNMRSATERLAAFLVEQAARSGSGPTFSMQATKRSLASAINIAPEMLNRCLRALEPHGVTSSYRTISVGDVRVLERVIVADSVTDAWRLQDGVHNPP